MTTVAQALQFMRRATAARIARYVERPLPEVYADLVAMEAAGKARVVVGDFGEGTWAPADRRSDDETQAAFEREFAQWRSAQRRA